MRQHAVWNVHFTAFLIAIQIDRDVAGRNISMVYPSKTLSPAMSSQGIRYAAAQDSPRFVDPIRMKQTFIAWPARHSIRLKCKANGSAPLRFQWLKDGQASIKRLLQPRLKTNRWYLKLKDLAFLDSGRYTCVVSNAYGSINHTYTLKVVEKSRTKPILKCSYPQNTSVLLGHNASLTCVVVISGTLPDFRWLKWDAVPKTYPSSLDFQNGSYALVNPTQYETVHVGGKYGVKVNIPFVTTKDLGMYTCYVSNHLGHDYRNAFLNARKKQLRGSSDTPPDTTEDLDKRHQDNKKIWETFPTTGTKLSPSFRPKLPRSREPKIPLNVFIGILGTWVVIATLALLWCHFYHKKNKSSKLGVEA